VPRLAGSKAVRLHVVHLQSEAPPPAEARQAGWGAGCRKAASVTTVYFVRGLRLLGQHFTAYVWTTESGEVRRDESEGPV
jgi:hypothetical protein